MNTIPGLLKAMMCWLRGSRVDASDIGRDYDRAAPTYALWVNHMAACYDLMVPRDCPPGPLADLCCGTGEVACRMRRRFPDLEIRGVDISPAMLAEARARPEAGSIEWINGDVLVHLRSLPDASLGGATIGWGLVYLPRQALFRELRRVLMPGAWLGILANGRGSAANFQKAVQDLMLARPEATVKVMDMAHRGLPRSLGALKAMPGPSFRLAFGREGSESVRHADALSMLVWLRETGVSAGTGALFAGLPDTDLASALERGGDSLVTSHPWMAAAWWRKP